MARTSTRSAASARVPRGRRAPTRISPARQISRGLFTAFAAALLLWPVYESSGVPRVLAICEVSAPLEMWAGVAFGWPVAVYGLLTTVGAGMFLRPKIIQAASLAAITAVGVEVVEFSMNAGHCRVRDLLPAAIGIAMAMGIHTAMRVAMPPAAVPGGRKKVRRVRKRSARG